MNVTFKGFKIGEGASAGTNVWTGVVLEPNVAEVLAVQADLGWRVTIDGNRIIFYCEHAEADVEKAIHGPTLVFKAGG